MIYYNPELDLTGVLSYNGMIQISEDTIFIPLTYRWVEIDFL